jgi:hypothetical protein
VRHRRAVLTCLFAAALAAAGAASAQTSFYVFLTSASIPTYSDTLEAHAWTYYRDSDCAVRFQCDRDNVLVEFTLHRGYRTYAPQMERVKTGQSGVSVGATFQVPDCRMLKKSRSLVYTLEVDATAPDGSHRHATRTFSQRSCRR